MRRSFALLLVVGLSCWLVGCKEDTASNSSSSSSNAEDEGDDGQTSELIGVNPPADLKVPSGGGGGGPLPAVPAEEFTKMIETDTPVYEAKLAEIKKRAAAATGDEQEKLQKVATELNDEFVELTTGFSTMTTKSAYWDSTSGMMKKNWETLKGDIDKALGLAAGAPLPDSTGTDTDATEATETDPDTETPEATDTDPDTDTDTDTETSEETDTDEQPPSTTTETEEGTAPQP